MYLREIEGWFASYKNITPQRASRPTTQKSYINSLKKLLSTATAAAETFPRLSSADRHGPPFTPPEFPT